MTKVLNIILVFMLLNQICYASYVRTRSDFFDALMRMYRDLKELEEAEKSSNDDYQEMAMNSDNEKNQDDSNSSDDRQVYIRQLSSCVTKAQCKNAFNALIKEVYKDIEKSNNFENDKAKKPFKWG